MKIDANLENRNDTYTYSGALSGDGRLIQSGEGTLILDGVSVFNGSTVVRSGTLLVEQALGNSDALVAARGGARWLGHDRGEVVVANDGILLGEASKTLTVGALTLNSTSQMNVELGAPSSTPRSGSC